MHSIGLNHYNSETQVIELLLFVYFQVEEDYNTRKQ